MIEIIATTIDEAKCIESSGAERIELISALSEGGLTPSYGLIESVVKAVKIPVNVIIRPHSKSFEYTKSEIEMMITDIAVAKKLGANGVVIGGLSHKKISINSLEKLLEKSFNMDVTFHRAFDELEDMVSGVKILSNYNEITSVLTSGGPGCIRENCSKINELLKHSGHINVLVGGGLTLENFQEISKKTNAHSFHFGSAVRHHNSYREGIDESKIKEIIRIKENLALQYI